MTDGKDTTAETAENANSSDDLNTSAKQSSKNGSEDVARTLANLQDKVDALARSLQSEKDKGISKTNQRIDGLEGDLRSILQAAQSAGKDVPTLLKDLQDEEEREARQAVIDFARQMREGTFQPKPQGSGAGNGVKLTEVLEDLELDVNDVRVKEFASRAFASQDEALREGVKLRKSIKTFQPSDADQASPESKRNAALPKQEELMKEYQEGSKKLYGRQLLMFKQQMRDKGLMIS